MSLESAVLCIESALNANKKCVDGLFTQKRVFGINKGPSGYKEILALLYTDDAYFDYWYGHILRHPEKTKQFVSLLVWSNKLVNAQTVPLLFQRFHYWIKDRLEYHPVTIQNYNDAYEESLSIEQAGINLAKMINRFDIDKRSGSEGSIYCNDTDDMRILQIYGLEDKCDENGCCQPLPMPIVLKIV